MPRRVNSSFTNGMFTPPFKGQPMNFHNQDLPRAKYQGPRGSGFFVEFVGSRATIQLENRLRTDLAMLRDASITSVVKATDEIKQKLRRFFDGYFQNSEFHGNNHRRAANAAAQSIYYNDIDEKGQFTGYIYSKLGSGSGSRFVDYLRLPRYGGTVRPANKDWLKLVTSELRSQGIVHPGQAGYFPFSKSTIFWAKSKDGKKLYLLRSYSKGSNSSKAGQTELLATMFKELTFKPSLGEVDNIARLREPLLLKNFDAVLTRAGGEFG